MPDSEGFTTDAELLAWLKAKATELCDGPYFIEGVKVAGAALLIERLQGELAALRETNRRLNARCQQAEAALPAAEDIAKGVWKGGSFGRALLAYGCGKLREENERLKELRLADALELMAANSEAERLRKIVGCVVRTVDRMDYGLDSVLEIAHRSQVESIDPDPLCGVTWGKVAYVCGLGSTSASALCVEFGVDPNHDVSHAKAAKPIDE